MKQVDCRNLPCPEPVLKTKEALENSSAGDELEILLNSAASIENVKRFIASQGLTAKEKSDADFTTLCITKSSECEIMDFKDTRKTIFIKDDKIGEGELGYKLIAGFIANICESKYTPKEIYLVNRGVFLTCENEHTIESFKRLEKMGCKIYSCGACLDYYNVTIKVGEVGNGFNTVDALLKSDGVLSI